MKKSVKEGMREAKTGKSGSKMHEKKESKPYKAGERMGEKKAKAKHHHPNLQAQNANALHSPAAFLQL